MNLKLTLILILASLAVVFVVQNAAVLQVNMLSWAFSVSGSLLIFFTLVTGFVLGWFVHGYLAYRQSKDELYFRN